MAYEAFLGTIKIIFILKKINLEIFLVGFPTYAIPLLCVREAGSDSKLCQIAFFQCYSLQELKFLVNG